VFPSLVCAAIAGQLIEIRNPQLPNECLQYRARHIDWVFEKSAEKASGGKLQRKAQAVVVTALDTDHCVVSVIKMEIARQLIRVWIANVPAIVGALFGSKELDGHRIPIKAVAQTFVCATKRVASEIKALRVA